MADRARGPRARSIRRRRLPAAWPRPWPRRSRRRSAGGRRDGRARGQAFHTPDTEATRPSASTETCVRDRVLEQRRASAPLGEGRGRDDDGGRVRASGDARDLAISVPPDAAVVVVDHTAATPAAQAEALGGGDDAYVARALFGQV